MKSVTVIDYGLSNLHSVIRALTYVGARVSVGSSPDDVRSSKLVVLPGVGAFGDGMRNLRERGLVDVLAEAAGSGKPLLGICLGMQLLFGQSEEFGSHTGLGLISGTVRKLPSTDDRGNRVKIPHIGWTSLREIRSGPSWDQTLLRGLEEGDAVYFVHSYAPVPDFSGVVAARSCYQGNWFCSVVQKEHITGCQFHPENSGEAGLNILRNFIAMDF